MNWDTRLILGFTESHGSRTELVVLHIQEQMEDGKSHFLPSISNACNGSQLKIAKEHSKIQVIENVGGGLKAYAHVSRTGDGSWHFMHGIVVDIQDEWVYQGSLNAAGEVVWDSNDILNRILES